MNAMDVRYFMACGGDLTRIRRKFSSIKHGSAPPISSGGARRDRLHLHDLGFFVLEMVIDRFDEAIGQFLHFVFHVAQLVLG